MPRGGLFPCRAVPGSYICFPECLSSLPTVRVAKGPFGRFCQRACVGGREGQCQVQVLFESLLHWRLSVQCLRRKSRNCDCRFIEPVKNIKAFTRQGVLFLMNIESWTTPSDHQSHTQELSASLYVIFISLL